MPKTPRHELGQTLMRALADFQRRLDADLARHDVPGVRQRHRAVFVYLGHHGASRSVDLAAAAGIRPQSMMKIVHELEELGLVTRQPDPDDSRAKLVDFSPAGRALLAQLSSATERVWQQYAQVIGARRLDQTLAALTELAAAEEENHE